jgi:hypothetical protein
MATIMLSCVTRYSLYIRAMGLGWKCKNQPSPALALILEDILEVNRFVFLMCMDKDS